MKVEADKAKSKKNIVKIIVIFFAVILLGFCSFYIASNTADSARLKAEYAELEATNESLKSENEKNQDIINQLEENETTSGETTTGDNGETTTSDNTDSQAKQDYMEEKAREYGYVKEGETEFYDIGSSK